MGPGDLSQVLAPLPLRADPRLIVGRETFDDAGVFVVSEDLALVQTLDFFAPIVDDPYTFGQVAAANALSDVFAMGGEPLTAMNIAAFPNDRLPLSVLSDILRGGQDKVHEAGAHIVGGHTVTSDELLYGLAVTGRARPRHLLTNAAARPGDHLILTKAIGTGILATAAKAGKLASEHEKAMIASMVTLNADASRAALAVGVRAGTDVTGFGLLGHASHMARASNVTFWIHRELIPVLAGTREALAAGFITGGATRNADYLASIVSWGGATEQDRALLVDPQTSGGMLLAVPAAGAAEYLSRVPGAVEIGEVVPSARAPIVLA